VHTVVLLTVNHGVHGTVNVQQDAIVTAPTSQAGVGGEATREVVVHDDDGIFRDFANSARFIICRWGGEVVTLISPVSASDLWIASATNRKRSRQRMNG